MPVILIIPKRNTYNIIANHFTTKLMMAKRNITIPSMMTSTDFSLNDTESSANDSFHA